MKEKEIIIEAGKKEEDGEKKNRHKYFIFFSFLFLKLLVGYKVENSCAPSGTLSMASSFF